MVDVDNVDNEVPVAENSKTANPSLSLSLSLFNEIFIFLVTLAHCSAYTYM
jgi:hypothetical protein